MKFDISEAIGTITVPLTGGANQSSEIYLNQYMYGYAVTAVTTAGANGTLKVQGSIDKSNWVDIDSQAMAGVLVFNSNKDGIYWPFIRVTWTNAAGAGTIYATLCRKGS
jgi:hypothetical protein